MLLLEWFSSYFVWNFVIFFFFEFLNHNLLKEYIDLNEHATSYPIHYVKSWEAVDFVIITFYYALIAWRSCLLYSSEKPFLIH